MRCMLNCHRANVALGTQIQNRVPIKITRLCYRHLPEFDMRCIGRRELFIHESRVI
jgi:hypothetical protein